MDLRESSLGFYRVWFATTGIDAGLFRILSANARTPEQAARSLGLDPESCARWCRGAHALGLLERKGGLYFVPRALRTPLADPEHPDYLGHHFGYLARKSLRFGALDDLLRGKAAREDLSDVYAIATEWDHLAFFERVLPRDAEARRILQAGGDVLDLGAGLGGWSAACAKRYPRARVVAAELDGAPLARLKRAAPARVKVRSAEDVDEDSFDLVFMGEVLAATREPAEALRAAERALRPGGAFRALEGLAPPTRRAPRGWGERLVLAMDFDFALDGSRFLAEEEAMSAMAQAGLVRRRARDLGGSLFVLAARKRQARAAR